MRAVLKTGLEKTLVIGWVLTAAAWPQSDSAGLDRVLTQMDAASRNFRTTQAGVISDQYQRVINETERQKGQIEVYQSKVDEVNEYNPGKNRGDVEGFLVLGFGGGGHDLLKSYDVKFLGSETANGVAAEKLELIPKSARLKNNIARILLWIDPARGGSVQQQFFEPSGDYRMAKDSDIQINQKLPDNAFKLKTTGKTKFISPQG